jgi:hypothetical protein
MTAVSMVMVGACAAEQDIDDSVYIKASNTGQVYRFGFSVTLSGDTLAVGSIGESSRATGVDGNQVLDSAPRSGAVYVFRDTDTGWQQEAYVKASNTESEDSFGWSVALSGDTLVVGAPNEDSAARGVNGDQRLESSATRGSGAVYVFRRNGTMWEQEAYLKPSNNGDPAQIGIGFGTSVAVSGDTLVVGAPYEDSWATGVNGDQAGVPLTDGDSGAAYVFRRNGTTWEQEAYVKASNTDDQELFGWSVGVSGDTIAVGAPWEDSAARGIDGAQDDDSLAGSGAVYVFRRSDRTWEQEAYVKASNGSERDNFGGSLALLEDALVVGARGRDTGEFATGAPRGAAYVFRRSGDAWQEEAFLEAPGSRRSGFGASVSLSDDLVVIGANHDHSSATGIDGDPEDGLASFSGAAYTFRRTDAGWRHEAYLKASNTDEFDEFGRSVAVSGETIAVGAWNEDSAATGIDGDQDDRSATSSGAVYVFSP